MPVTIIGAGIIGACCALSLLEMGHKVRIIDPMRPRQRASFGNAGVISPWSCVPQAMPGVWRNIPRWLFDSKGPVSLHWSQLPRLLPWALRFMGHSNVAEATRISAAMAELTRSSIERYRKHLKGSGQQALLCDSCYLHVFRDSGALRGDNLGIRLREAQQAPMEVLNASQLRDVEPELSEDYQTGLLIRNQARTISPGDLCAALLQQATSKGAEIVSGSVQVLPPTESWGWILETDNGQFTARQLVIAAGIGSAELLRGEKL